MKNNINKKTISKQLILLLLVFLMPMVMMLTFKAYARENSSNNIISNPQQYKWVFMMYIGVDNDLEKNGMCNLNDMEGIDLAPAGIKVVVFIDRGGKWKEQGGWTGARAYEIGYNPEGFSGLCRISSASKRLAIPSLGISDGSDPLVGDVLVDSGSADTLTKFISFVKKSYPAEHYMLILSDHGTGWESTEGTRTSIRRLGRVGRRNIGGGIFSSLRSSFGRSSLGSSSVGSYLAHKKNSILETNSICLDESSNESALTIPEIRTSIETVFGNHRELDILAFDACLMGTVEVAYELRNAAKIMLASAETEPNEGYPYSHVFRDLVKSSDHLIAPQRVVSTIVNEYVDVYTKGTWVTRPYNPEDPSSVNDITMAAWDLSKIPKLQKSINVLGQRLIDERFTSNADDIFNITHYQLSGYVDLYNFNLRSIPMHLGIINKNLRANFYRRLNNRVRNKMLDLNGELVDGINMANMAVNTNPGIKNLKLMNTVNQMREVNKNIKEANLAIKHGSFFKNIMGLSIFLPHHHLAISKDYSPQSLEFLKDTPNWYKFLQQLSPTVATDISKIENLYNEQYLQNGQPIKGYIFYNGEEVLYHLQNNKGNFSVSLWPPEGKDYDLYVIGINEKDEQEALNGHAALGRDFWLGTQGMEEIRPGLKKVVVPANNKYKKYIVKVAGHDTDFDNKNKYTILYSIL